MYAPAIGLRRRALALVAATVAPLLLCGGWLLGTADSEARSSMRDAIVTQAGGQPCFALPVKAGDDMRLYGISVIDTAEPRRDWRAAPVEMWGFAIDHPGLAMASGAASCVQYGQTPAGARERQKARPLQPATVYRVDINARPLEGGGATVGYTARFCVKALANGALEVRVARQSGASGAPSTPNGAATIGDC